MLLLKRRTSACHQSRKTQVAVVDSRKVTEPITGQPNAVADSSEEIRKIGKLTGTDRSNPIVVASLEGRTLSFSFLALLSFPGAPTGFRGLGAFNYADEIRVRGGASFLREYRELIKLVGDAGAVFSQRSQAADHPGEAGVDVQHLLVNWQLHALGPRLSVVSVRLGAVAIDVIVGSPGAVSPAAMTLLGRASGEGKWLPKTCGCGQPIGGRISHLES